MNAALFTARRLFFSEEGNGRASKPAVRVATIGLILGMAVMILSIAIVVGFKKEVRNIVVGFGSHIQLVNYDNNYSYETLPIYDSDSLRTIIQSVPEVKHLQRFATKPGIIKTDQDFQGIVVKGVGTDYDWNFFKANLREGEVLSLSDTLTSNQVMISSRLSDKLNLHLGNSFITYFIQDNVRARKFKIVGIYDTHCAEYDEMFMIADIRQVQRLNQWEEHQISGIEIMLHDFDMTDTAWDRIYTLISNRVDKEGSFYYPRSIHMMQPQILEWLNMLDMNVWIILFLLLAVAGFTMISGLLIIILERIPMIGILKALGASDLYIRKIFLYLSFFLIGRGMLIGNALGLLLCYLQYYTHWFKLDSESYYLSYVPIEINYLYILVFNIGVLFISLLLMILPSYLVTRIAPSKTIRFD